MEPKIIYQDESILVLDKPAGWVVNEAETTTGQPVVQTWLTENFKYQISNDQLLRNGIVHRLDKETSGILLVAKTEEAFKKLQAQFKSREVTKTYIALLHGKLEPSKGIIEVPVGRLPWNRERFGVLPGGRESQSEYEVNNYYFREGKLYSLTLFKPKTGRTHQIRIHAKYLNHPVVSDEFYAGRKTARADRLWCPRLFLHASGISFEHPGRGDMLYFESKLPQDLRVALAKLTKVNV